MVWRTIPFPANRGRMYGEKSHRQTEQRSPSSGRRTCLISYAPTINNKDQDLPHGGGIAV